jgi:hypothetical protein
MVPLVLSSTAGWAKIKLGTRSMHASAIMRRFLFMYVLSFLFVSDSIFIWSIQNQIPLGDCRTFGEKSGRMEG